MSEPAQILIALGRDDHFVHRDPCGTWSRVAGNAPGADNLTSDSGDLH